MEVVQMTNPKKLETILKDKGLGYVGDREPTDNQISLQDEIDGTIHEFLNRMQEIYSNSADLEREDVAWDIGKITEIRETVEGLLNLPDIY